MAPSAKQNSLASLTGTLVLVGAGKMGGAMLDGWLRLGLDPKQVVVIEPQPTKPVKARAPEAPSFAKATAAYEAWLGDQLTLVPADLQRKHAQMRVSALGFLRATFYRWAQLWPIHCPELADAPRVLSVGDLHIENFGDWRDIEGRLVWGVNDFDEACQMPYAQDLVRLAASALLSVQEGVLPIDADEVCPAILKGYKAALKDGGRPFVLNEDNDWLRALAIADLRDPDRFARKLQALTEPTYSVSRKLRAALGERMPQAGLKLELKHRVAGLGSLGRQRVVAIARWYGGIVVREAKPLTTSSWVWAGGQGSRRVAYDEIIARAERCPDPYAHMQGPWIIRRLAADSASIEIDRLPRAQCRKLLSAMGKETANIHLGGARKTILQDLKARPRDWLERAADRMVEATLADWEAWKAVADRH